MLTAKIRYVVLAALLAMFIASPPARADTEATNHECAAVALTLKDLVVSMRENLKEKKLALGGVPAAAEQEAYDKELQTVDWLDTRSTLLDAIYVDPDDMPQSADMEAAQKMDGEALMEKAEECLE